MSFCKSHLLRLGRGLLAMLCLTVICRQVQAVEPHVTTGNQFSVYLAGDGQVWTWGVNGSYQLGLGDTNPRTTPTLVPGISDVIAVSAGLYHVLALKADGTVWMWGRDSEGESGDGLAGGYVTTPTQVASLSRIIAIAAGGFHCMALQQGGTAYGWGYNYYGQAGVNSATTTITTPASISGNYRELSGGLYHSLAISTGGAPFAWGRDSEGQLGDDATKANKIAPVAVAGGYTDVISIAAGGYHSLMARANMATYGWGEDYYGQVGNGTTTNTDVTTPVNIGASARRVMAGYYHSMAYYPGGYVYMWGLNSNGQCRYNPATTPQQDTPLGGYLYPRFDEVSMGLGYHTPIILYDGRVQFWGDNSHGEFGLGSSSGNEYSAITTPAQWSLDYIIDVSAGNSHSLALKADGTVWSWGSDTYGQLGNDITKANKTTPVKVSGIYGVLDIAAGGYHSLALNFSGQVYAWGQDINGQLGDDATLADQPTPVLVSGLSSIVSIGAGAYTSYAIPGFQGSGKYNVWGADFLGQLGDGGTNTNQPTPVSVTTVWPVRQIDGGYGHTVFLSTDGNGYGAGYNYQGQLGDSTNTPSNVPVATAYGTSPDGIEHVAAGQYHTIGSRYTGSCMIWGSDSSGQLGNGEPKTNINTPGFTSSPYETKDVSAGADFADWSMLLTSRGLVYVAGNDDLGQLGDDATKASKSSLTQVSGIDRIVAISAGDYHGLALRCDGTLFAWGNDGSGQLGDDSSYSSDQTTPVTVNPAWLPTVTLNITDATANEAGLGVGQFQLVRTETNAGRVKVSISTAGDAISGTDYTAVVTPVEIPGSSSSVYTNIVPIDDNDDEDDEDIKVNIVSNAVLYRVGSPSSGTIILKDNDTAKIILSTISANTQESHNNTIARTFTVVLDSRPQFGVTLTFASSNTLEGRVDTNPAAGNQNATTLTFTGGAGSNWNVPQTVQVFGQQDTFDDGDRPYEVQVTAVTTTDAKYAAALRPIVNITNIDDDTAGITVDPTFGSVTEAGGTNTFNVRLDSEPYYPVTLLLDTDDHSEGLILSGQESIVLNSGNWSAGVNVTVVGQDDDFDDGDVGFKATIAPSQSSDTAYNNKGGWGVTGTCIDNDTKEVRVVSSAPYAVTEGGGSVAIQYRLMTRPIGVTEVRIAFSGGSQVIVDADPGTFGDQATLVIPATSWNTPRTVLVRAVDDAAIEGAHLGTVSGLVTNVSGDYWSDPLDAGPNPDVDVPDVSINITDNDTPGFVLTPATDASNRQATSEGGDTAVFKVHLATQPGIGSSVTLVLITTDPTEGRLDQAPVSFAATAITGSTNRIDFTGGTDLSGLLVNSSVMVTSGSNNIDKIGRITTVNDASDFIIVSGITVGDDLIDDGAVTIATALPQILTFDNSTWDTDQTVTVTGLDDGTGDGNIDYTILGGVDTSVVGHDTNYTGLSLTQYLNNIDDDVPGVRIIQSGGVTAVGEGGSGPGATDTFTVQLNGLPTTTVTVSIVTDGQVTSSRNTLTFTTVSAQAESNGVSGYDVPQTITLTAVDDLVDEDSPHSSTVSFMVTAPFEGSSPSYNGISVPDLTLEVTDNDTASINVSPTTGAVTSEAGFSSSISVTLGSQPTANVDVYAVSLDPTEGTLGGGSAVVATTTSTVSSPFHVFNVSDATDLAGVTYGSFFTIASGANAGKQGVALAIDNIAPGKSITAFNSVAGDSFVASGVAESLTVYPSQVKTFTATNWYIPQHFTVTGVNDDVDDGDQVYFLYLPGLLSGDAKYAAIDPPEVFVVNSDDDTRGVVVDTLDGVSVTEGTGTDSYTVTMSTRPTATVTMTIATDGQTTVDTPILTFDPTVDAPTANAWNLLRTVTVTAVNDQFVEGVHTSTITHATSGGGYGGLAISNVTATVTDDAADVAEVLFSGGPTYSVSETGTSVSVDVTLRSRPFSNVTLVLSSNDPTEGAISPSTLTFSPGTYNVPQSITITGLDDAVADGDIAFAVQTLAFSGDSAYNGLAIADLAVTTQDDDTAGIEITPASGTLDVGEDGSINSFAVRLRSQPTSSVTIALVSSDPLEGVPLISSLVFDASNWSTNQFVQVQGVDDDVHDGDQTYTVGAADTDISSSDLVYDGNFGFTVDFNTIDDDEVGVAASVPFVTTTENGSTVTFQLVLLSEPDADVTIPLQIVDSSEATISVASVTFIPSEWDTPQTVTVTPVDDFLVDGDVSYTIELGVITAPGETTGYAAALDPADIPALNKDDDTAGFSVSEVSVTTNESGSATATFDVVLTSQPSDDVIIAITGLDTGEGALTSPGFAPSTTELTFTNGDWDTVQTVTVTGVDDFVDDGDQIYVLDLNATSIGDASFNGLGVKNVSVTNQDDDTAGVVIVESGGSTTVDEAGGNDTYTINLSSQPATTVTITVTPDSQVRVNGVGTPTVLTFNPAVSGGVSPAWDTVHTMTVTAVQDTFDESDPHAATITHGVSGYGAITAQPVSVTVIDNNPPTVVANTGMTITRAGNQVIDSTMLSYTDVETAQAALIFNLILQPGQGSLYLDYGLGTQALLNNSSTFTMGDIQADRLTYVHAGTANNADGFAFRVQDAIGNLSDLAIFDIAILGYNPPAITFSGGTPSFTEGGAATTVDLGIGVTDPDSTFYNLLTVSLVIPEVDDELFLVAGGQITLSGNTVNYAATPIGTWSGGTNGNPLVVSLAAGLVGDAQGAALMSAVQFRNISEDPVVGTRGVRFVMRDETDTENSAVSAVRPLDVFGVNDPPTITGATLITPKNVAIDGALVVGDVDSYPLTLTVTTPPGKGTLSGALDISTPTSLADALTSRVFTYTPITGQEGTDSFIVEVTDPEGAPTSATITVLIVGGAAAKPWVVSDPPVEAEAGSPLSYDIVVDFIELAIAPTAPDVSYSLVGTLPAGVTLGGFTPSGTNATMTLVIGAGATGVIEAGIVVTETVNNTTAYQPITIVIVPAGALGG